METEVRRRRQQQEDAADYGVQAQAMSLSGQSYWLDLWLFLFFDLALFLVIYLLP